MFSKVISYKNNSMCGISFLVYNITTKKVDAITYGTKSSDTRKTSFRDNKLTVYVRKVNGVYFGYFTDDKSSIDNLYNSVVYIDFEVITSLSLYFSGKIKRKGHAFQNKSKF